MKGFKTILAAGAILLISCTVSGAGETITLSTNEWPPFLSEKMPHNGGAAWIVEEAFSAAGISVEYVFLPWKRAYDEALSGAVDGSIVWSKTADREKEMYFSDPVIETRYVFFHLRSYSFEWKRMEDLRGLTVGGIDGFNYGPEFLRAREGGIFTFEGVGADEQNYRKLVSRRIDLFPQELQVGRHQMTKYLLPEERKRIVHHPRSLKTGTSHLVLRKSSPGSLRLLKLFNRGLKELRESGKAGRMLESVMKDER